MEQRLSLVTLGVADVPAARAFYEALGWTCNTDPALDVAFFQLGGIVLAVWDRKQLAEDSTVTDRGGFGGVTLAYNVRSPEEVDAALAEAEAAGATIGRPGAKTFWGGYSGVFVDPDGHPWEVAHNPHWTIEADGSVRIAVVAADRRRELHPGEERRGEHDRGDGEDHRAGAASLRARTRSRHRRRGTRSSSGCSARPTATRRGSSSTGGPAS